MTTTQGKPDPRRVSARRFAERHLPEALLVVTGACVALAPAPISVLGIASLLLVARRFPG